MVSERKKFMVDKVSYPGESDMTGSAHSSPSINIFLFWQVIQLTFCLIIHIRLSSFNTCHYTTTAITSYSVLYGGKFVLHFFAMKSKVRCMWSKSKQNTLQGLELPRLAVNTLRATCSVIVLSVVVK